ncbi:ABC transporter permease [Paenibacillus sp. R14(2021)]|uniref:ABC transporter permease n=1 Tax=Paenibacillus sp. R14(2021) TaxID=2859228 RepID=UPI001C612901|nr:ABC transporter permease [Paenibacillus sp. R14(2021)]
MRYVANFIKYKDLLAELVRKDIKIKYRHSYLGVLWSLLNPLLMMIVLTVIFSAVFKNHIEHFPLYVLTGRLIYSFFSDSTSFAMNSIVDNSQLIKKIYVPKYFFPIARVLSTSITSLVSLIPIFIVMLISGVSFHLSNFLIVVPLALLIIISTGIGLILSVLMVFFRDLKHMYSIFMAVLMYMTPIFYPESIIPHKYLMFIELNPMYPILDMFRTLLNDGGGLHTSSLLLSCTYALFYLLVGLFLFYKKQDRFIFYI